MRLIKGEFFLWEVLRIRKFWQQWFYPWLPFIFWIVFLCLGQFPCEEFCFSRVGIRIEFLASFVARMTYIPMGNFGLEVGNRRELFWVRFCLAHRQPLDLGDGSGFKVKFLSQSCVAVTILFLLLYLSV